MSPTHYAYVFALLAAAITTFTLAIYGARHYRTQAAPAFVWLMASTCGWTVLNFLGLFSQDFATADFWHKAGYLMIANVTLAWIGFSLTYSGMGKWLTPWRWAALSVVPVLMVVLAWTNTFHHLFWAEYQARLTDGLMHVQVVFGVGGKISILYTLALILAGALVILVTFLHAKGLYRWQTAWVLAGVSVPLAANILYNSGLNPGQDLTTVSFAATGILLAIGIFHSRLLDLTPIARDRVIEDMPDAVIVLDTKDRIVDINPAAQRLIEQSAAQVIGRSAQECLSKWPDLVERYRSASEAKDEVTIAEGEATYVFDLRLSSLTNQSGQEVTGRLLVLRDVTERKRAEEALRRSEQRFHSVVEHSLDGILLIDDAARIVAWNRGLEQMTGIGRAEVIGRPVPEGHHRPSPVTDSARSQPSVAELIQSISSWPALSPGEHPYQHINGQWHTVEENSFLIPADKGTMWCSILRDVTERRQMDQALRENEHKLRAIIEQSSDAIILIDEHGCISEWNHAAEAISELPRDQVVGQPYVDVQFRLMSPERRTSERYALYQAGLLEGLATGDSPYFNRQLEALITLDSGEKRYTQQTLFLVDTDRGRQIGSVVRDITDRKRAEAALLESEARARAHAAELETVLEAIPIAVLIARDPKARLVVGNRASRELLHLPPDTPTAPTAGTPTPASHRRLFKDGLEVPWPDHPIEAALQGRPAQNFEADLLAEDGTTRHVTANAACLRDDHGEVYGAVEVLLDITEHKQAEARIRQLNSELEQRVTERTAQLETSIRQLRQEVDERRRASIALQESEQRYRILVETSPDAIILTDLDSKVIMCNRQALALLGYARESEAVGQNALDFFTPEDHLRVAANTEKTLITRQALNVACMLRRNNGSLFAGEVTDALVADSTGRPYAYIIVIRDITERKRMEEQSQRRQEMLEVLNHAGQAFGSTLDLNHVLGTVLDEVRRRLDSVACSIWLKDPATGEIVCQQAAGPQNDLVRGWRLPPDQGIVGWVVQHNESLMIPDVKNDFRHFGGVDKQTGLSLHAMVAVPLRSKQGVIGVIEAGDLEAGHFKPEDLTLLELLALTAVSAIENARLYARAQQEIVQRKQAEEDTYAANTRLQSLSRQLVEVQESERRRLALELHDELGQTLNSIKMSLDMMDSAAIPSAQAQLQRARTLMGDLIGHVRELALRLRPAMLDDLGLVPALVSLFKRHATHTGVFTRFQNAVPESRRFPSPVETAVYRIAQEGLTNATRHACVKQITVQLQVEANRLNLTISDAGAGFVPDEVLAAHTSTGLSGMRERARLLGGDLVVESAPGAGTRLTASLPVPPSTDIASDLQYAT
jgi:PAS domain S-box-containing protein